MKMRKISLRTVGVILLITCVICCSCGKEKNDKGNDDDIFISIAPYEAENVEELLKPWYEVQKGILQWTSEPITDDEADANEKISYFYNLPTITIVSSKKQEYVFSRVDVLIDSAPYKDADKTIRFYFDYTENGEVKDQISVSINDEVSRYIKYLEEYGDEDQDGMISVPSFDPDYACWYYYNGAEIIYLSFSKNIVSFDFDSIFETFEFDTISIAEYESRMMK